MPLGILLDISELTYCELKHDKVCYALVYQSFLLRFQQFCGTIKCILIRKHPNQTLVIQYSNSHTYAFIWIQMLVVSSQLSQDTK
jgi:hypothetical protein